MYVTLKRALDQAWARNRSRLGERNHLAMDADLLRDMGLNPGDLHVRVHAFGGEVHRAQRLGVVP